MMRRFLVLGLLLAAGQASPVAALDCANASEAIEKLCSDPALKKADDDMNAAYLTLLSETKAPDFHEALIRSQQRWLEARLDGAGLGLVPGDTTGDLRIVLQWTRDRLEDLSQGGPIRRMETEQKQAEKESGGPFAGYDARCDFWGPGGYRCSTGIYRQHYDRICSVNHVRWTLGVIDYHLVSVVTNGKPRAIAGCAVGRAMTEALCPPPYSAPGAHWTTHPNVQEGFQRVPEARNLWKYDPDVELSQADQSWMNECLFTAVYPPLEVTVAGPPLATDALDCDTAADKERCSTSDLKQADEEMNAVYLKLLDETTDPEFHDLLIRSQQRWLETRAFGPVRRWLTKDQDKPDGELLLKWTRERLDFLRSGQPIRAMEEQRKIAAKDSGGRFAGYASLCQFWAPPLGDWGYACRSEISRQHHNRICSAGVPDERSLPFARSVKVVENGRPRTVARCSIGGGALPTLTGGNAAMNPKDGNRATITIKREPPCPDPDQADTLKPIAHWNTSPNPIVDKLRLHQERWKYDPDLTPAQYAQPWMNECLSAPVFPPLEQSRPDEPR
jgi:uncharacterized protein YecT (DUF1311 family)